VPLQFFWIVPISIGSPHENLLGSLPPLLPGSGNPGSHCCETTRPQFVFDFSRTLFFSAIKPASDINCRFFFYFDGLFPPMLVFVVVSMYLLCRFEVVLFMSPGLTLFPPCSAPAGKCRCMAPKNPFPFPLIVDLRFGRRPRVVLFFCGRASSLSSILVLFVIAPAPTRGKRSLLF